MKNRSSECKFKNVEELRIQMNKDNACHAGRVWINGKSLDECIRLAPPDFRLWFLLKGYIQFAISLEEFEPEHWELLLKYRPEYAYATDSQPRSNRPVESKS